MEKVETPDLTDETTKTEPERLERVARCIECSNEWIAMNGNEPKPSRCPSCMSRDVKWRDECTGEEVSKKEVKKTLKKKTMPKTETKTETKTKTKRPAPKQNPDGTFARKNPVAAPEPEKEYVIEPKYIPPPEYDPKAVEFKPKAAGVDNEKFTYEDAVRLAPKIPMQSIVFLMAAAALVFGVLFLVRKSKGLRHLHHEEAHDETQEPSQLPYFNFGGNLA